MTNEQPTNLRVVTNSYCSIRSGGPYWRCSIYEFRGNPGKAFFVEDLQVGFTGVSAKEDAMRKAEQLANSLGMLFCPNIEMFDNVEKVYHHFLK